MDDRIYVLDNGAYSIKVGFSNWKQPKIIPNCIMKAKSEKRRIFVGDQIEDCRDPSGLFYILPFKKGLLMNWDTQKTIWDYVFSKECCPVKLSETPVIFSEPYFNFVTIQESVAEIFFEEYDCQALLEVNSGDMSAFHYLEENKKKDNKSKCCVVVDSGYSFTYIAPYINGKKYKKAVKRVDVGGKLLTNHLKDIISYRQLNVMEETYVMNQVKEDCCFVSQDLALDLKHVKQKFPTNEIVTDYILPDFTTLRRGYMHSLGKPPLTEYQKLRLNTERFTVPELLFHPSDIGIDQMGLPEAIVHCISLCPEAFRASLYGNIVLTGGSALLPGFQKRLFNELRNYTPSGATLDVCYPENPQTYAWEGGAIVRNDPDFYSWVVSKEEYEEEGMNLCKERFGMLF